jgi:hypothetical protein
VKTTLYPKLQVAGFSSPFFRGGPRHRCPSSGWASSTGSTPVGLGGQAFALLIAVSVWMAGSVILGMLTLVARRRRVTIEERN